MKIGTLAARSGLSPHTIRYYERIGLLPRADRDAGGWRDYDDQVLVWIAFLDRLKATGMSIRDMLRYARLREQGTRTTPERRQMLEAHRTEVQARIALLQSCLCVLDTKIDGYVDIEKRMQTHDDTDAKLQAGPRAPSAGQDRR